MGRSKLFTFFLLGMFMLSFVSAWQSDNFIKDEDKINKLQTKTNYGKYIIEDTSWYDPLGIWTKKKTKEVTLKNNSDFCGEDCFAIKEIKNFEEGSLIDDIRFYRIYEDGSQQLGNIRSYQISYWGEDGWIDYELGKIMPIGVYKIKLEGKKKPSWTYDWQVLLGGTGVWSEEWAVWGTNYFEGSEYQLILFADSVNEGGLEINGIEVTELDTGMYKINSTGGRNSIMETLFYGTNGADQRCTSTYIANPTKVYSNYVNDNNKRGYYFTYSVTGVGLVPTFYTATFSDTSTNLDSLVGGYAAVTGNTGYSHTASVQYPHGTTITGGGLGESGTDDDTSSPTSKDNQPNVTLYTDIQGVGGTATATLKAWILATGTLSYAEVDPQTKGTPTNKDFYTDESFPIIEYYEAYVVINSPTDDYISPTNEVKFNCSATVEGGATISNMTLYTNETGSWGARNSTTGLSGTTSTQTWNRTFSDGDNILWSCQACDSDEDCGFAGENRTLLIDVGLPNITIETPTGVLDYGAIGNIETLNVTFTDINLESCWYDYNGTNITIEGCLTGVKNSTTFILEVKNYNMTIYANDSVGNLNFSFIEWEYKLLKSSEVYSNTTRSGSIEDFILNVTLGIGYDLTSASLIYGNETLSPSIVSSGQDRIISVSGYNIPLYQVDTNVSFYWEILLDDSTEINTTTNIQQVQAISLDNCSVYTFELFNLSLYTEREKTPLLGDIELNFQLLNYPDYEVINSLIINIENISTTKVCSDINLSLEDLYYSAEIRYSSEDYASELYHIQRAILPSTIQNIDLYDLNSNFSTEFKVTYQDSTFNFIEGAVIQLQRKYIAEGIYETVEAPLTSNDGIAIVHIDLDTVKYRATVVKDGVVLDEFDNLVLKCQSELTGECEQKLLGTIDPQNNIDLDTTRDFSYSIDRTDNVITTSFTIPSGTPSSVNFQLVQKDQFGSSEMCNKTITSSAGSLQCTFNDTIGDSYIDLRIYKNAEPMAIQTYIIPEASSVDFLGNNYIIIVVLLLSIVGMALTSPEWIIINGIIVMVISGALWLASGLDFVMGLGSLMWLIIAAGILIFKLAKQEDR